MLSRKRLRASKMWDLVITILIFVGVIGVTAALFGGWIIVSIVRFIARAMAGQSTTSNLQQFGAGPTCPNDRCRTTNPQGARFCRRCGQALGQPQRATVRRAAMW
jgi:hypothetical protein